MAEPHIIASFWVIFAGWFDCRFFFCVYVCAQIGLGDIVSLAKTWKKLNAEDLLGGDTAALASAVKVGPSFSTRPCRA